MPDARYYSRDDVFLVEDPEKTGYQKDEEAALRFLFIDSSDFPAGLHQCLEQLRSPLQKRSYDKIAAVSDAKIVTRGRENASSP